MIYREAPIYIYRKTHINTKPEDQWFYKRSLKYWPGITTKNEKGCHSDQFLPEQKKKQQHIFVEDNVINMFEKFQFHPPYGFSEEDLLTFFF